MIRTLRDSAPTEKIILIIAYLALVAWAVVSLFPIYWMLTTALKPPSTAMSLPPEWIPRSISLENFSEALLGYPVLRWTLNSAIMAGAVTGGQLLFATMAGYGFSKKRFRGRELIFWVYLSSMMVPGFALLVPLYTMMAGWHLINTYVGLIAPGLSAPFGAFLMRQFIQTLPNEVIDAGKIDGCSELALFWRIIVPLAKPGIAVLGIFAFVGEWNAFLWPLIITSTEEMRTLVVGFAIVQSSQSELHTNYGATMAASTYMAIPMLIVFFAFQRYFLRGITIGALKG
ncbi:MAG TPA: carbohydrate ABC transporter permease [Chloroflexota bacterium]|nr:carbohydrate ABC transporter permease [Chloroflexota bacterium]